MELIIGIITLIVAAVTLYVSIIAYRYVRMSDKKREEEEKQKMQDEYDVLMSCARYPMNDQQREFHTKKYILEKGLKRTKNG